MLKTDWYGKTADKAVELNDTFIRACIKTGALTPPPQSAAEKLNRVTAYAVICIVAIGAALSWVAVLWK